MNRCADRGPWKNSKEDIVGAANAIVPIDRRDGAYHSFEHLIAELTFAAGNLGAFARLTVPPLRFPDSSGGHEQTSKDSNRGPDFNGTRRRICHGLTLLQDLLLLVAAAANQLV